MKSQVVLKSHISYSVFTGFYTATLLGGEFANCYGQGRTAEVAMISLRIRYWQLKNKKQVN